MVCVLWWSPSEDGHNQAPSVFLLPFPPWDLDSDAELEVCICRKTVGYRIWLPCFWAPRKPRTLLRQLSLWHSCCLSVVRAPHPHPASFALTKQMLHHTLCLSLFSKPEVVQENNNMSGMDNGLLLLSDESLAPGHSVAATVVCDHNERPGCPAALVQPGRFFFSLTLSAGGKKKAWVSLGCCGWMDTHPGSMRGETNKLIKLILEPSNQAERGPRIRRGWVSLSFVKQTNGDLLTLITTSPSLNIHFFYLLSWLV